MRTPAGRIASPVGIIASGQRDDAPLRAPSLTELHTDGVHFATPGFPLGPTGPTFTGVNSFVPNPDLEPDTSLQYETGARWRSRRSQRGQPE